MIVPGISSLIFIELLLDSLQDALRDTLKDFFFGNSDLSRKIPSDLSSFISPGNPLGISPDFFFIPGIPPEIYIEVPPKYFQGFLHKFLWDFVIVFLNLFEYFTRDFVFKMSP